LRARRFAHIRDHTMQHPRSCPLRNQLLDRRRNSLFGSTIDDYIDIFAEKLFRYCKPNPSR
jgi:hypothetical protein